MAERFQFLEPIGVGGVGIVWNARGPHSRVIVAVQVPHPRAGPDRTVGQAVSRACGSHGAMDWPLYARRIHAESGAGITAAAWVH